MPVQREVELAQLILNKWVRPALENKNLGAEGLLAPLNNLFKNFLELFISDSWPQWHVYGMVPTFAVPKRVNAPGTRKEVVPVLVEADGHDSVRQEEGLFDAVSVVNIYIHVHHTLEIFKQFQDGEHNVIDIAEPGGFRLARVVQPACPVDANISFLVDDQPGAI